MRIIPAIDIIEGKCVRLRQGDYTQKVIYNENPLEMAKEMEDNGVQFLHLVDLDGAKAKQLVNHKILELIATKTNLLLDFGGGIKRNEDLRIAFESGAKQVTVGSVASQNPTLFLEWLEQYGPSKIILGADCQDRRIATNGWLDKGKQDVGDFIQDFIDKGVKTAVVTDIEKDGMLAGPSIELYDELIKNTGVQLIASGGITTIQDLRDCKQIGCEGAIIGKAIYEGRLTWTDLNEFLC